METSSSGKPLGNPLDNLDHSVTYSGGQMTNGRAKQKCYYMTLAILYFVAIVANILSLAFFVGIIKDKCILFNQTESTGQKQSISCYTLLAADSVVILATIVLFLGYVVCMVKGAKIVSGFRVVDVMITFILALVSATVGITVNIGVRTICKGSPKQCEDYTVIYASEYLSLGVAAFYCLSFLFGMAILFSYCICTKRRRRGSYVETTPILIATTVKPDNSDNPFNDDAHM